MASKADAPTGLQQQLLQTQNSLFSYMRQQEQVNAQIQQSTYQSKHREATMKALGEVPDAQVLKAIGKVYYFMPREQLLNDMKKDSEKARADLVILNNTKVYVDKKSKETEEKLAELLKQAQAEQQDGQVAE